MMVDFEYESLKAARPGLQLQNDTFGHIWEYKVHGIDENISPYVVLLVVATSFRL